MISYRICPIRIEAAAGIRWGENFRLLSEPARIRTRTPRRYHIIRTTGEHGALNSQNPAAENKTKKPQCLIRNRDTCPLLSYPCWVYSCLLLSTPVYSCLLLSTPVAARSKRPGWEARWGAEEPARSSTISAADVSAMEGRAVGVGSAGGDVNTAYAGESSRM